MSRLKVGAAFLLTIGWRIHAWLFQPRQGLREGSGAWWAWQTLQSEETVSISKMSFLIHAFVLSIYSFKEIYIFYENLRTHTKAHKQKSI